MLFNSAPLALASGARTQITPPTANPQQLGWAVVTNNSPWIATVDLGGQQLGYLPGYTTNVFALGNGTNLGVTPQAGLSAPSGATPAVFVSWTDTAPQGSYPATVQPSVVATGSGGGSTPTFPNYILQTAAIPFASAYPYTPSEIGGFSTPPAVGDLVVWALSAQAGSTSTTFTVSGTGWSFSVGALSMPLGGIGSLLAWKIFTAADQSNSNPIQILGWSGGGSPGGFTLFGLDIAAAATPGTPTAGTATWTSSTATSGQTAGATSLGLILGTSSSAYTAPSCSPGAFYGYQPAGGGYNLEILAQQLSTGTLAFTTSGGLTNTTNSGNAAPSLLIPV